MRKAILFLTALLAAGSFRCAAQFEYTVPFPRALHDANDTLELFIIGDVMMHAAQLKHEPEQFLANIAPKAHKADFAIANLEFSLGGEPYTGYPAFSAPDYYPHYLAEECGFDVFLTANNHILDRGSAGLERTLEVYRGMKESQGITFTGISGNEEERMANSPLILDFKGIRVALLNFTYGTNNAGSREWPKVEYMKKEDIAAAFKRAREQEADFIIVLPHWGEEYRLTHSSTQQQWAEWLVEQGADAIVGAHPHVVQDSTSINGKPVFYSLGNAVSNMSAVNTRIELAVTLRLVNDRVRGIKKMLAPEVNFMWCTLPGKLTDSYASIFIKEWANRKNDWLIPSDFDNMIESLERVKAATGISD